MKKNLAQQFTTASPQDIIISCVKGGITQKGEISSPFPFDPHYAPRESVNNGASHGCKFKSTGIGHAVIT